MEAANSVLLKSLDKAAKYFVEVLAFTNAGEGIASKFTITTADDGKLQLNPQFCRA